MAFYRPKSYFGNISQPRPMYFFPRFLHTARVSEDREPWPCLCVVRVRAVPQVEDVEPEEIQHNANACLHEEHNTCTWHTAKTEHHAYQKRAPVQDDLFVYECKNVQDSTDCVEAEHFDQRAHTSV
jgi:hypothetical protein